MADRRRKQLSRESTRMYDKFEFVLHGSTLSMVYLLRTAIRSFAIRRILTRQLSLSTRREVIAVHLF